MVSHIQKMIEWVRKKPRVKRARRLGFGIIICLTIISATLLYLSANGLVEAWLSGILMLLAFVVAFACLWIFGFLSRKTRP